MKSIQDSTQITIPENIKKINLFNGINLYEIYIHFPVTKKIYLIQTYIFYGNLTKEFICCQSKFKK